MTGFFYWIFFLYALGALLGSLALKFPVLPVKKSFFFFTTAGILILCYELTTQTEVLAKEKEALRTAIGLCMLLWSHGIGYVIKHTREDLLGLQKILLWTTVVIASFCWNHPMALSLWNLIFLFFMYRHRLGFIKGFHGFIGSQLLLVCFYTESFSEPTPPWVHALWTASSLLTLSFSFWKSTLKNTKALRVLHGVWVLHWIFLLKRVTPIPQLLSILSVLTAGVFLIASRTSKDFPSFLACMGCIAVSAKDPLGLWLLWTYTGLGCLWLGIQATKSSLEGWIRGFHMGSALFCCTMISIAMCIQEEDLVSMLLFLIAYGFFFSPLRKIKSTKDTRSCHFSKTS